MVILKNQEGWFLNLVVRFVNKVLRTAALFLKQPNHRFLGSKHQRKIISFLENQPHVFCNEVHPLCRSFSELQTEYKYLHILHQQATEYFREFLLYFPHQNNKKQNLCLCLSEDALLKIGSKEVTCIPF